jgi:putative protease
MKETEVGVVKHYFDRIGVAAIEVTDGVLSVGDTIRVKGHTTDVTATVDSMQVEHDKVQTAARGAAVGIRLTQKVREHDKVFKVEA